MRSAPLGITTSYSFKSAGGGSGPLKVWAVAVIVLDCLDKFF